MHRRVSLTKDFDVGVAPRVVYFYVATAGALLLVALVAFVVWSADPMGTMRLFNGERWIDATAGDFLYVSEGGVHAFGNESGEPASMLILFAPGAPREAYFEALAEKAAGRWFSDEEWRDLCRRHDNYFIADAPGNRQGTAGPEE